MQRSFSRTILLVVYGVAMAILLFTRSFLEAGILTAVFAWQFYRMSRKREKR